jgi:hypothetical protein
MKRVAIYRMDGAFLYVSAQTKYEESSISCRIISGGNALQTASSKGDYVIATCSGRD